MQIYLVGGAVRDQLLGLPVKDRDWVVVGADADELLRQGYQPVGKDFPVFLHPVTRAEYALARLAGNTICNTKSCATFRPPLPKTPCASCAPPVLPRDTVLPLRPKPCS